MDKILVTGCRRTGTTFLGRMLSIKKNISYIHEPFNYESGIKGLSIQSWYPYYTKENILSRDKEILSNLFNLKNINPKVSLGDGKTNHFKYNISNIELIKNIFTNFSNENLKKRIVRLFFKNRFYYSFLKTKFNFHKKKVIIKDPIASLTSKYLVDQFDFKVIIIIRHPAAYYYSMKKQDWGIEPKNFLSQKLLLEKLSDELIEDIKSSEGRQEYALYEYIIIYKFLLKYLKNNPKKFIIIKHEDLSEYPNKTLKKLYKKIGMSFSSEVSDYINKYTSQSNPTKAKDVSSIKRNSSNLIHEWKDNLCKNEIEIIKKNTSKLVNEFYDEETWLT